MALLDLFAYIFMRSVKMAQKLSAQSHFRVKPPNRRAAIDSCLRTCRSPAHEKYYSLTFRLMYKALNQENDYLQGDNLPF